MRRSCGPCLGQIPPATGAVMLLISTNAATRRISTAKVILTVRSGSRVAKRAAIRDPMIAAAEKSSTSGQFSVVSFRCAVHQDPDRGQVSLLDDQIPNARARHGLRLPAAGRQC